MDATGYFGASANRSGLMTRDQNQSLPTIESYNDDALFDSRPANNANTQSQKHTRPKSGYIMQSQPGRMTTGKLRRPQTSTAQATRPVKGGKAKQLEARTKPNHILHDPEALREEVHSLNRRLDELRRLNQGLTGKLGNLE
jgi:hypothetical protein